MSKTHKNELFYSQNWTNDVQNCHNKHKKGTKKSSTVQFNIFYSLPLIPVRLYSQQLVLNVRNTGRVTCDAATDAVWSELSCELWSDLLSKFVALTAAKTLVFRGRPEGGAERGW